MLKSIKINNIFNSVKKTKYWNKYIRASISRFNTCGARSVLSLTILFSALH